MKRPMLFGVVAALVGVGAASIIVIQRVRRAATIDSEKSIDSLVDYCETKVEQLDSLLKTLPRDVHRTSPAT